MAQLFDDLPAENDNPFRDLPPEGELPEPRTQSEAVFQNLSKRWSQYNDPRGAALTIGTDIAREGLGIPGIAGMAGFAAGMVPGGESPAEKGTRYIEATRRGLSVPPPNPASEQVVKSTYGGLEKVGKALREVPAALATTSLDERQDMLTPEDKARIRQDITERGIGKFMGETAETMGAPPSVSAAVETLPTAVALVLGLKAGRLTNRIAGEVERRGVDAADAAAVRQVADEVAPGWEQDVSVGKPSLDQPVDVTPRGPVDVAGSERIAQNLRRQQDSKAAAAVRPDQEIIAAAERLDITLNPEHYSTNAAFQDVARALKTHPGSKLEAAEKVAMQQLSSRADDIIIDINNTVDKAAVSESVRASTRSIIDDLDGRADAAYKSVNASIPATTKINPRRIKAYVDERLAELGGNKKLLNPIEKKLMMLSAEGQYPTYAALDRIRKDIGAGYKRRGPFGDVDTGALDQAYGLLSDVQQGVAEAMGAGETFTLGKQLVSQRKNVEAAAIQMFGKQLSDSLVPKMRSAATGLTSGDVGKFNKLMESVPVTMQEEVAAAVLSDIFSAGSRRGGELSQGFVASYQALNRNQAAKNVLFKYLPTSSRQRFDDIGKVLTGIIRSNQKPLANPSGTAAAIVKALEDGSALGKIYDVGKQVAAAEGVSTTVGLPGGGTALVLGKIWAQRKTTVMVAADELLSSPRFAQMVRDASPESVTALQATPQYRRWYSLLPDNEQQAIMSTGLIGWLTQGQSQNNAQQNNR